MDPLAALRERILAFAASRYGRQFAEDVAQEVLLVIHEKYSHLSRPEDLLPVALKITRFKMMAMVRKSIRRGEHRSVDLDDTPLPDHSVNLALEAEQNELLAQLERALPRLGQRCQELFRLKLKGLDFPQIQTQMGAASINTVYTWDHRCREELKAQMTQTRRPQ